jgi:hypothetical protein
MGELILKFDTVEEQIEINDAINGHKWRMAMWDLDQQLRSTTKHGVSIIKQNQEASDIEYEVAEKYREIIREILQEYGLNLDLGY